MKEEEKEQIRKWWKEQVDAAGGGLFTPLAALVDLAWHYHYQHQLAFEEEKSLGEWLLALLDEEMPGNYCAKALSQWDAERLLQESEDMDSRLWGLLGKIHMLLGHAHLRQIRIARQRDPKQAYQHITQAVNHIALSFEYNHLLGGHSHATRRAEASLYDWLLRHGQEPVDYHTTVLEAFMKVWDALEHDAKGQGAKFLQEPRLAKFLDERFGRF